MRSRILTPRRSSKIPGRFTCPLTPNNVWPVLFVAPSALNQSAPLRTIAGTCEQVSAFSTVVGRSQRPRIAGNGGRLLARPLLPPPPLSNPPSFPALLLRGPLLSVH